MARISDDDLERIRSATDLAELVAERTKVQRRGREIWCCCPLHHEKTPSFKIDTTTQLWHCFGCGEGGDAFGFIMKADDLTFPEAVRKLADRAHIEISESNSSGYDRSVKQRLKDVCKETASFYHMQLMRSASEQASAAREYLSSRSMGADIPKIWNLGFSPGSNKLTTHLRSLGYKDEELIKANVSIIGRDGKIHDRFFNRVMFPIADITGEIIAFGGRVIGTGEPKYLNSQETPIFHKSRVLYGLDKAKSKMASSGVAVVAEGYTDVIAMHKAGITNAVATLGTALTKDHIRQLSRQAGKKIIYLFDGDTAGQRATERALQFIDASLTPEAGKNRTELCALCLPDGLDPKEFLDSHSADELQKMIDEAPALLEFGLNRKISVHDLETVEGRASALSEAISMLAPIKDSILAKEYAVKVASRLHMSESDVLHELAKAIVPVFSASNDQENVSKNKNRNSSRNSSLTVADKNRVLLERELLGRLILNPIIFIQNIDGVSLINWRTKSSRAVAESVLAHLMENLDSTSGELLQAARLADEDSIAYITSVHVDDEDTEKIAFLIREIRIDDIERRIAKLKTELDKNQEGDNDAKFEELVALQKQVSGLRSEQEVRTR